MPAFSAGFKPGPQPAASTPSGRNCRGAGRRDAGWRKRTALYGKLYDAGLIDADFSIGWACGARPS